MAQVSSPGQSGYDRDTLSDDEQTMLETALARSFEDIRTEEHDPLQTLLMEYRSEIGFAAEVAKAQFNQQFDGLNPDPGYYGIDTIHSGYFGYDDWDNCPDGGGSNTTVDWLTGADADQLSSTGSGRSDPIRIGENAVHLVTAIGSHDLSPTCTRLQMYKNDNPNTSFSTDMEFRTADLRIKPLQAPLVLAEDDDLYVQYLSADNSSEALYLFGVSFIPEKQLRTILPGSMPGEDIVTTP